jgi:hypothetical protein
MQQCTIIAVELYGMRMLMWKRARNSGKAQFVPPETQTRILLLEEATEWIQHYKGKECTKKPGTNYTANTVVSPDARSGSGVTSSIKRQSLHEHL